MRLWIQAARLKCVSMLADVTPYDKRKTLMVQEDAQIEPLLLHSQVSHFSRILERISLGSPKHDRLGGQPWVKLVQHAPNCPTITLGSSRTGWWELLGKKILYRP